MLEQPDVDIINVLSGRSAQYRIQRKARPLVPAPGRNLEEQDKVKSSLYIWTEARARICKRLRSPGIDAEESIPPAP